MTTTDGQGWRPFTGDYDKMFYELRAPGGEPVFHFWPNAGRMYNANGIDNNFGPADGLEMRPCTCRTCSRYHNGAYSPPTSGEAG